MIAFANERGLPVKADEGATYYIGGKNRTAVIQTDTDFGTAAFLIDDTAVQNRRAHVFLVSSRLEPFPFEGVASLKRNQEKIDDGKYWGIMGSNYCKNLLFDNCTFSRFDAHMGVANATIRNSTLGHQGINAIGSGVLTVENTTVQGRNFINLRSDYGSTWRGEFVIRNCVFVPAGGRPTTVNLIGGSYSGQHDFGYTCYMPERITIESLHIDDSNHPANYRGPAVFANFNPRMIDDSYVEELPYVRTREVILRDVTTASGKPLRLSDNPLMFKDVKVTTDVPLAVPVPTGSGGRPVLEPAGRALGADDGSQRNLLPIVLHSDHAGSGRADGLA